MGVDILMAKAIQAREAKRLNEARALFAEIINLENGNAKANYYLGRLSIETGNIEGSLDFFKSAIKGAPNTYAYWEDYLNTLIDLHRIGDAEAVLKQAIQKGATADRFLDIQKRLNKASSLENPLQHQHEALSADVINNNTLKKIIKLAYDRYRNGDYASSKKILENVLTKFPQNRKAKGLLKKMLDRSNNEIQSIPIGDQLFYNGNNEMVKGNIDSAIGFYRSTIKVKPHFAAAFNNLGVALHKSGLLEEAIEVTARAIEIDSAYTDAHYNLGRFFEEKENYQKAQQCYKKAISVDDNYPDAFNSLGNLQKRAGDFRQALASYNRAIDIKADFFQAYTNIGNTYIELKDLALAISNYEKAIDINPRYGDAHTNKGRALFLRGELAKSIDCFQTALKLNPRGADDLLGLGTALEAQGKLDLALEKYHEVIKIRPEHDAGYIQMGNALQEKGDSEGAIGNYKKALMISPASETGLCNLGIALYGIERFREASECFAQVDNLKGRSYLLRCSYLLNEQESVQRQLKHFIGSGEANSLIGSIVSRASCKYGVRYENPFCNDPLAYVKKANLKRKIDFDCLVTAPAKTVLRDLNVNSKSQPLLIEGTQTAGNLFALSRDKFAGLEDILRLQIDKYLALFRNSNEGFIRNWPREYSLYGWIVSLKNGGKLKPHIHENGWLSGSCYIQVPEKSNIDSGNLVVSLGDDSFELNDTESFKSLDVRTGDLCLFPASLLHHTVPFQSPHNRIVLAFDVIPM